MSRYRVTISHDACTTHDVVADSPEDAGERAMEGCDHVTLCHHCSDKLAMGDPIQAACVENLDDGSYTEPTDRDVERLQAQVAELTAEVETIRRDALRYRWLRNESWSGYNQRGGLPQVWTTDGAGNRKTMLAEDAMDEAIDRARGC